MRINLWHGVYTSPTLCRPEGPTLQLRLAAFSHQTAKLPAQGSTVDTGLSDSGVATFWMFVTADFVSCSQVVVVLFLLPGHEKEQASDQGTRAYTSALVQQSYGVW